jgi:hypothetical protein
VDQVQQLCCPWLQAAWHKMKTKCHPWVEIRDHFRTLRFDSMAELLTENSVADADVAAPQANEPASTLNRFGKNAFENTS